MPETMNKKELEAHMKKRLEEMELHQAGDMVFETYHDPERIGMMLTADVWGINAEGQRKRFTKTVRLKEE